MTKHIPHFEVLRGVAALWVLISHVLLIVNLPVKYLSNGGQAVELFVILSGFVIALMRSNDEETYGVYIFRRWARLYPLFLIALLYGGTTDHLYAPVFGVSPWIETVRSGFQTRELNLTENYWEHLLLHITMLHGVVPDTILPQAAVTFSGPLWSISLEWQFYLIAPFLIGVISFATVRSIMVAVIVIAATLILDKVTRLYWVGEVPSFLPVRLPLFVVGILSAALWNRARATSPTLLAVCVAISFFAALQLSSNKLPLLMWFATYYVAAIHEKLALARWLNRVISSTAPRFVGRVSYGLYVLHVPTMMLITYYLIIPALGSYNQLVAGTAIFVATTAVTLGLAHLSFKFIETPVIRWARRSTLQRKEISQKEAAS